MRTRVTVQALAESADVYGQPIQAWADLARRWCELRTPTGRDVVVADQLQVTLTDVVLMRADPILDPTRRLVLGDGRILRIVAVLPLDQRRWLASVLCVAQTTENTTDEPSGDPGWPVPAL